jgi:hypothetical protein
LSKSTFELEVFRLQKKVIPAKNGAQLIYSFRIVYLLVAYLPRVMNSTSKSVNFFRLLNENSPVQEIVRYIQVSD